MKKLGEKNPEMEKKGKKDDQGSVYVFHFSFSSSIYQKTFPSPPPPGGGGFGKYTPLRFYLKTKKCKKLKYFSSTKI